MTFALTNGIRAARATTQSDTRLEIQCSTVTLYADLCAYDGSRRMFDTLQITRVAILRDSGSVIGHPRSLLVRLTLTILLIASLTRCRVLLGLRVFTKPLSFT